MRRKLLLVAWVAACVSAVSCTTIEVRRVTGNEKGIRYCLPQKFLLVKPNPDGTVTITPESLPDPTQMYAVHTETWFAKHKLEVHLTEEGLLKKVTSERDDTAVPAKLIESAGNIAQAGIQAAAQAGARERAPEAAQPGSSGLLKAHSPILYRVVETKDTLNIVAVNRQEQLQTSKAPKPATTATPKRKLTISGPHVIRQDKQTGALRLTIKSSGALSSILQDECKLFQKADNQESDVTKDHPPTLALQPQKDEIIVDLEDGTPKGQYRLRVEFKYRDAAQETPDFDAVVFEIRAK